MAIYSILNIAETICYILYICWFFFKKEYDRDGLQKNFVLSCIIVIINVAQLLWFPSVGGAFSKMLSVLVIAIFGFNAKNCYDRM